jgi:ribonuclease BN (tRNA processing enzyme)
MESIEDTVPVARYAISGVGDALARLCADQRFKLAPTRAVFCPANDASMDGMSALLLALHSSGSPSLHIVMPPAFGNQNDDNDTMEELATIVLGPHKHFDIRTCQVHEPKESNSQSACGSNSGSCDWWKVYEDEFLEVHASCYKLRADPMNEPLHRPCQWSLIFLYTVSASLSPASTSKSTPKYITMAVLPPKCCSIAQLYEERLKPGHQLPLIRGSIPMSTVDFVVALDPIRHDCSNVRDEEAKYQSIVDFVQTCCATTFLLTVPQHQHTDEGILIRSQQLARYFHQHIPHAFASPKSFLKTSAFNSSTDQGITQATDACENLIFLKSCTSLDLKNGCAAVNHSPPARPSVMDRRKAIWEMKLKEEWNLTLESLRSFFPKPRSTEDENEIVLDDDDDDYDNECKDDSDDCEEGSNRKNDKGNDYSTSGDSSHHLLVLGTGCATPSAYRGASGYALVLHEEIFLLDCGEGVLTALSRSCGERLKGWKQQVRGIWISHAHLDHYGGLPSLLRILYEERTRNKLSSSCEPPTKRPRPYHAPEHFVPWVMAPPKVLRYLDIMLHCRHGRRCNGSQNVPDSHQVYFIPRVHQDPTLNNLPPPGPWFHFENINVQHNCCPAYGLLLGWKKVSDPSSKNYFLCYSGDTRPSHNIVIACRRAVAKSHNSTTSENRLLTLIHEATFADDEIENAQKKKHSTISEALRVASDILASQVLLTHFSQRYISLRVPATIDSAVSSSNMGRSASSLPPLLCNDVPVGLAADGLWIPMDA